MLAFCAEWKYITTNGDREVKAVDLFAVCNGNICYHGGTLDLNTCKCNCSSAFTGDLCEESEF